MQPYFLPYIGYFQLINSVDYFVLYDNIEYTKKGWINRNRYLQNGKDNLFTIPLRKDSDFLDIKQREISESFNSLRLLSQIQNAYRKAPYFDKVFPLITTIIYNNDKNLFNYIYNSIKLICELLCIQTQIVISSDIPIDHSLKSENKVIDICNFFNAQTYINSIGGKKLYDFNTFNNQNIELCFLESDTIEYDQFTHDFVPSLSILDVLMFNSKATVQQYLEKYTLQFKKQVRT